jgi:hypothetical protein
MFLNYFLPYKRVSELNQATQILKDIDVLLAIPELKGKKFGILYSANLAQTDHIRECGENIGRVTIEGANQAQVMHEVLELLERRDYQHLQANFRILPVTTLEYVLRCCGLFESKKAPVSKEQLQRDLGEIERFMLEGNVVLGWYNTKPQKDGAIAYAIGGKIATLTEPQRGLIQETLRCYYETYKRENVQAEFERARNTSILIDESPEIDKSSEKTPLLL